MLEKVVVYSTGAVALFACTLPLVVVYWELTKRFIKKRLERRRQCEGRR